MGNVKEIPKAYNSKEVEKRVYDFWEKTGFFNPDKLPRRHKKPFSMVLPPPNVTGTLHIGHALTVTLEDIIMRYQRMLGKKTLWIPGTDHASIATETKFLKETNIRKSDYNTSEKRNRFIKLVNQFALKNQKVILKQLKSMGASLDWSRLRYTLDKERTNAVQESFIRMHPQKGKGIIYMGKGKVINWDPKGQTVVDDQEIEYEAGKGILYTFRYSKDFPIAISTTRPETKVGDTAVAVHPKDNRYKQYIGKRFNIEFVGEKLSIKIVGDPSVDPAFGTGALGVTPAHSIIDEGIASRHNLPSRQVINESARMAEYLNPIIANKKIDEAREIIVNHLKERGLLEKEEVINQNIPKAQRSGGIIEQLPKRHQFFISVNKKIPERNNKTLKELMREAVKSGKIKIIPKRFEKIYFNWIENIRDWSISRQIWYGHRLPVWYKPPAPAGDDLDYIVSKNKPTGDGWEQFTDTLDTWFSSSLWTFSTLGWPNKTKDLKIYHPTDVLETGYDILFFWVARMILMSTFLLGEVPFRTVYLHGLVRDEQRRKISKSLGNVIDPLVMIEKYGTDAFRFALIFGTTPGTDSVISKGRIRGMKNFANKIWNASRFVLMNTKDYNPRVKISLSTAQKKYLKSLGKIVKDATKLMDNFKFYYAAEKIYHYFWHTFCDKIIEESKPSFAKATAVTERQAAQYVLLEIFSTSLKLLHPFIPFITEEIYQALPTKGKRKSIMIEKWPK